MAEPLPSDLCEPWIGTLEVKRIAKYEALNDEQLAPWLMVASELAYKLSGERWGGICTVEKLRPYYCGDPAWDTVWRWRSRRDPFATIGWCGELVEVDLSGWYPIVEVTEVKVDGVVLDPTRYQLVDRSRVVRTDGGAWPWTQDVRLADSEPGTWSVSFRWGQVPPEDAQTAAAILAGELALAQNPGLGECQLPEKIQTITRQGVTMTLLDPLTFIDAGRTGIYLVDLWIQTTGGRSQRATLSVPGTGRAVRWT